MSDLIERLRCKTPVLFTFGDPSTCLCIKCTAADALEAKQGHYERIKSQTCLCRFDKALGEGEPGTVPSNECEYHRAMRERIAELEAALPVDYWEQNCLLREKQERIEQLEAALQWEAAVAGDECAYPTGEFCFDDKPESPDLWCTYCRIIWVLGEKE